MADSRIDTAPANGDDLVGRVLEGRYRLVRRIATGGMGRVYLAEQQALDRLVAVKVLSLPAERGETSGFEQRFFREARQISRLTHPNTVRIFDYGHTDDGIYFIVMAYVEGQTLTSVLKAEGWLDPLRACRLLSQVCASLTEVHSLGLIHRDVKPDNILITNLADGREFVTLVDFGITKDVTGDEFQTAVGEICGSPGYMSPEQIKQEPLTARSDVYALGAVLFRMLTGQGLFKGSGVALFLARHVDTPPPSFADANPRVTVPATLEWVVRTCLAKSPDERFASAKDLSFALQVCELELLGMIPPVQPVLLEGRMLVPHDIAGQVPDTLTLTGTPMAKVARPSSNVQRSLLIVLLLVVVPLAVVAAASSAALVLALVAATGAPQPAPENPLAAPASLAAPAAPEDASGEPPVAAGSTEEAPEAGTADPAGVAEDSPPEEARPPAEPRRPRSPAPSPAPARTSAPGPEPPPASSAEPPPDWVGTEDDLLDPWEQ